MAAHHELDECLETLYHLHERHELTLESLRAHEPALQDGTLEQLTAEHLVTLEDSSIHLTEEGFRRAEQIIRRHRLAERLLNDVLHMGPEEVEKGACEFEHMLAEEITESICILLGHPRTCPHGSPIPEGPCCRAAVREYPSAVVPITEAPVGCQVRVAYVCSRSDERQHQLAHFGIVPGSQVKVHQLKPAVILVVDGSMLAMEEHTARDLLVWKGWHEEPAEAQRAPRLGFWRRRKAGSAGGG